MFAGDHRGDERLRLRGQFVGVFLRGTAVVGDRFFDLRARARFPARRSLSASRLLRLPPLQRTAYSPSSRVSEKLPVRPSVMFSRSPRIVSPSRTSSSVYLRGAAVFDLEVDRAGGGAGVVRFAAVVGQLEGQLLRSRAETSRRRCWSRRPPRTAPPGLRPSRRSGHGQGLGSFSSRLLGESWWFEVGRARAHDVVSFVTDPGHRWVLLRGP